MQVRDVMTRKVISVGPHEPLLQAARLMLQNRISGLPVVDAAGQLVGIVTEGDFLRRGEIGTERRRPKWLEFLLGPGRLATEYVHASGRKVDEVMTADPCTVSEDDSLETVVELMERRRIKRLPVMRDGKMVGIVSRANLMHALASLDRDTQAAVGDDVAIRDGILKSLGKQPWAPNVNVVVKNGVAELWGTITDERERQACIVTAENVAGVHEVHDHLVWVEPMSGMAFPSAEDEAKPRTELAAQRRALNAAAVENNFGTTPSRGDHDAPHSLSSEQPDHAPQPSDGGCARGFAAAARQKRGSAVAGRATRTCLRAPLLRQLPRDRQGERKPAQGGAAVAHVASALSGRKPARLARRRHHHRPPDDGAIPARSRPSRRCHRLPEVAGAVIGNK